MASDGAASGRSNGGKSRGSGGIKFARCPNCSKKGFYKVSRRYEHCRCCGLHRLLLPGQDF